MDRNNRGESWLFFACECGLPVFTLSGCLQISSLDSIAQVDRLGTFLIFPATPIGWRAGRYCLAAKFAPQLAHFGANALFVASPRLQVWGISVQTPDISFSTWIVGIIQNTSLGPWLGNQNLLLQGELD